MRTTNEQNKIVYIPENLNLYELFPKDSSRIIDKYKYLCHKINEVRMFNEDYKNPNCFVPLYSVALKNILRDYKFITDSLEQRNVIEISPYYSVNNFSKGFRFTQEYRYNRLKGDKIHDYVLNKALQKHKNNYLYNYVSYKSDTSCSIQEDSKLPIINPNGIEYEALSKNTSLLDFVGKQATEYVEKKYNKELKILQQNKESYRDSEFSNILNSLNQWYGFSMLMIGNIEERNYRILARDVKGHRFHSLITNMPSELRQFLRYKGKQLYNVDIRNSQPFLYNILLLEYYQKNSMLKSRSVDFINNKDNNKLQTREDSNTLLHYVSRFSVEMMNNERKQHKRVSKFNIPIDVLRYREETSKGTFYEYLMNITNIPEDKRKDERSKFKKTVFRELMFSKPSHYRTPEIRKLFNKSFPNVCRVIDYYKEGYDVPQMPVGYEIQPVKYYTSLPIHLQRKESHIIINTIGKELAKRDIFFVTIHDSFLCQKKDIIKIEKIIKNAFRKEYNLIPSIKKELA